MSVDLRISLYQQDIPGNTGTILRMAACFGLTVDIIEPTGFDMSDRALRRAGMSYAEQSLLHRHLNWRSFLDWRTTKNRRLILAITKVDQSYLDFPYRPDDVLLFGRESAGAPDEVHALADARLRIPMVPRPTLAQFGDLGGPVCRRGAAPVFACAGSGLNWPIGLSCLTIA